MAVKRKLLGYSGMRLDWPHIRSIESAVSNDFDALLRGLITGLTKPYVIRGFKIKIPNAAINASSLQIEVADSAILHPNASESGTILTVPAGTPDEILSPNNPKVIGSFQSGVANYVSLDYRRVTDTSTIDQTAGWSPSQQIEFQRAVPIGQILEYRFIITTNGFSTNLPLYIVGTDNVGAVTYITKATPNLFRLGSGGANPNPFSNYDFNGLNNPQTGNRREWANTNTAITTNPISIIPGDPANAFDFGDFGIKNLKDWMDAVMTRFKEITGSPYWYISANLLESPLTLENVWWDSIGSVLTGAGSLSYNLILETLEPTTGRFQSSATDSSILVGDSYVEGATSGTKATLSAFNNTQLLINSLTNAAFTYGEKLYNRRIFRPNPAKYTLIDYSFAPTRWGILKRTPTSTLALNAISSWSYQNVSSSDTAAFWSIITITTSAPHNLNSGDIIEIKGLQASISQAPNGVAVVKDVISPTQFTYYHPSIQAGVTSVLPVNGFRAEDPSIVPFTPRFHISSWSYSGTNISLIVPYHNFHAPIIQNGDVTNGSKIISNLTDTSSIRVGDLVTNTNFPANTYVTKIISNTSVEVSNNATATQNGTVITFRQLIHVTGLVSGTNAPNGVFVVDSLGPAQDQVNFTASLAPTGTASVTPQSIVRPNIYTLPAIKVLDAVPNEFNINDTIGYAISDVHTQFVIGSDALPTLGNAVGSFKVDGVIAESIVIDPVRVASISNPLANVIEITTTVPHGLTTTAGPLTFTIYGDSTNSDYIRTYYNVSIVYVSPTVFRLTGSGVPFVGAPTYTNLGTHNTFIKFADNPYAGPIMWDSDIVIKGIIGDKYFRIPKTAIAYTTSEYPDVSPIANKFNINGQTGTLYLQNGEVAYIILERNKPVSLGAIWTTAGGSAAISSSTPPLDVNGNPLVAGDFVKFEDEDESKWARIAGPIGTPITGNSFTLVNDSGQPVDIKQRPAKTGKLVYTKATYSKVYVKKHYLVNSSGDVYWIAVRRDNQSQKSKVYFRGLEVEAGEVRQLNDNQTSNVLQYIGSPNEGAINPNYSVIDTSGDYQYQALVTVEAIDVLTRMITFVGSPQRGFQIGDRLKKISGPNTYYFTVKQPLSSRTVVVAEDVTPLLVSDTLTLYRENKNIEDQDNLTLALRKEDRELGAVQTALKRPVYDESVYIQQINLSGAGTIRSGSYIYKGPQNNPTALAWVLHGNAPVVETIETAPITMPGGHSTVGPNAILVHILFGNFLDGDGIYQNGVLTGRTVNNPGNNPFPSPSLYGDTSSGGLEIVLPPNKRTQVVGTEYIVFPTHSIYKASTDPNLTGEDLLVIVNDQIKQAVIDYEETFGGPKAKIRLRKTLPPNSRLRFRTLAAFGSVLAAKAGDTTLQVAYNGGATIQTIPNRPVEITSDDVPNGTAGLITRGSILINGGVNQKGGIFNELLDQSFVIGNEQNKPKETWTGIDAVKTHQTHPNSGWIRKTAAQIVTGASGTIITGSAITLDDETAYRIRISAVARRSDGTFGVASFSMEGTFYRTGGGSAQAAGSPISVINGADGDGINYAIAFGLLGNDVVAVVYGTTGSTIQWALSIEYQAVGAPI